jgi:hypothetical protein
LANPGHHVNHSDVLRDGEELSWVQEHVKKHVMMVGSWSCMVSSGVHISGRRVGEPVPESKDEKDPKRTCMVLSMGREVAGPGYSRL